MIEKCPSCILGFHDECGNCKCCTGNDSGDIGGDHGSIGDDNDTEQEKVNAKRIRKEEEGSIRDPHSTGRKRAAIEFPLVENEPCEWQGLARAGGGTTPIVGCLSGTQQNRHHGPDKNTLNNSVGNVHRICTSCHNNWHAKNDPGYDSRSMSASQCPTPWLPHDPITKATDEELIRANMMRELKKEARRIKESGLG